MLHTKFQGNRPSGSGEEDFFRFLPYIGVAAILVIWLGRIFPPLYKGCIWNIIEIGPVVSEEKSFENLRQITSDLWPRSPNDLDL